MIVVIILLVTPSVKSLVYNEHTHLVASMQECFGRNVVGSAQSIESGFLELFHTVTLGTVESCRSQYAIVMMDATTVEQYGLAVKQQTAVSRPCNGTKPEPFLHLVYYTAVFLYNYAGCIEIGGRWRPRFCIGQTDSVSYRNRLTTGLHAAILTYCNSLYICCHLKHSFFQVSAIHAVIVSLWFFLRHNSITDNRGGYYCRIKVGSDYMHTMVCHMGLPCLYQPNITVNTRTAIPSAILLLGIVHFHGYSIPAFMHIRRYIDKERRISVGVSSRMMTVDIDFRIHIYTLEIQLHLPAGC